MVAEGGDTVKYEIRIDPDYGEPRVVILTAEITEEVNLLVKRITEELPSVLCGIKDEKNEILEPDSLLRIYASAGKVIAATEQGEYTLRLRLYEAEERLKQDTFVRISNSEIVNLKKVKNFDLSIAGTISIRLVDGTVSYVSRRYVAKIKKILGI